jgi:hypothetical protein
VSKIVFTPPAANAPGYLRREIKRQEYLRAIKTGNSPETIMKLVDFLLPYVTEPEDRDQAREALLDASEEQFSQLLNVVGGGGEENPTK